MFDAGVYSLKPTSSRSSACDITLQSPSHLLGISVGLKHRIRSHIDGLFSLFRRMSYFCQLHVLSASVRSLFFSVLSEKNRVLV